MLALNSTLSSYTNEMERKGMGPQRVTFVSEQTTVTEPVSFT